jgi:hypothetical protein
MEILYLTVLLVRFVYLFCLEIRIVVSVVDLLLTGIRTVQSIEIFRLFYTFNASVVQFIIPHLRVKMYLLYFLVAL